MTVPAYEKLNWVNGGPPAISGPNLDKMDQQIKDITDELIAGATSDGWSAISAALAFSSADGHTFVATVSADLTSVVPVGARIKLTQTTVKYFIVTAVAVGSITLYGGTDYTLANAAITAPSFSIFKAPVGFPLDPAKWTERMSSSVDNSQASPVGGAYYNPGSLKLDVPIGAWDLRSVSTFRFSRTTGRAQFRVALSTSPSASSDPDLQAFYDYADSTTSFRIAAVPVRFRKLVKLAAKTPYYLVFRADTTCDLAEFDATQGPVVIEAVCAYL